MHILNTLAPVFVLIGLGALLNRLRFLDAQAVVTLNRCCYWIGLPALLFYKIGIEPAPAQGAAGRTVLALLGATALLLAAALLIGLLCRQSARALATFMHVAFRGNLAYVGLPVVVYAFEHSPDGAAAGAVAAMALGVCVVVYNVSAVFLHLAAEHRLSSGALRPMLFRTATNPLLLACLAGFIWQRASAFVPLPLFVSRSLVLMGQFALPLALLSVGSALAATPLRHVAQPAILAAMLKTLAGPLLGAVMARLFGLSPMETAVVCILMATPTAVASYVLTEQLGGDGNLAAGAIAISTLLSAISLGGALWLFS